MCIIFYANKNFKTNLSMTDSDMVTVIKIVDGVETIVNFEYTLLYTTQTIQMSQRCQSKRRHFLLNALKVRRIMDTVLAL